MAEVLCNHACLRDVMTLRSKLPKHRSEAAYLMSSWQGPTATKNEQRRRKALKNAYNRATRRDARVLIEEAREVS